MVIRIQNRSIGQRKPDENQKMAKIVLGVVFASDRVRTMLKRWEASEALRAWGCHSAPPVREALTRMPTSPASHIAQNEWRRSSSSWACRVHDLERFPFLMPRRARTESTRGFEIFALDIFGKGPGRWTAGGFAPRGRTRALSL